MRIYLSAGEHSGDMHGATLAAALREFSPGIELTGMGGPLMRAAGVDVRFDPTQRSTIGFMEALRNLGRFRRLLKDAAKELAERRPDAVVWVDFGGFNLALAKIAHEINIPVVCVFSPSAWAYNAGRAARMAECVTELAAVLPFEADFYRRYGLRVTFVGHPLIDLVRPSADPERVRAQFGLDKTDAVLALLPGSRSLEIQRLLPTMLGAVSSLRAEGREFRVLLPLATADYRAPVEEIVAAGNTAVELIDGRAYDVLSVADAAVVASGTATLETALLGVPMVSVYRVSRASYLIYQTLKNRNHRGKPDSTALPNLIAGRQIVPELLQDSYTLDNLTPAVARLMDDDQYRKRIGEGYADVRNLLGQPGVMRRVAQIVLDVAGR